MIPNSSQRLAASIASDRRGEAARDRQARAGVPAVDRGQGRVGPAVLVPSFARLLRRATARLAAHG